MAGLLSSALVLTAVVGAPLATDAKSKSKSKKQKQEAQYDWALVNYDRLVASLIDQGVIDEDATEEDINEAVAEYVKKGKNPNSGTDGIDISSEFGKKALKARLTLRQNAANKIAKASDEKSTKSFRDEHIDNSVVALIEFPDFKHNQLKEEDNNLWTEDFNEEHYENMLFNPYGYITPEGNKLMTMTQYYYEQSAGSWALDGKVTPWITAEKDAAYYGAHKGEDNDSKPRDLVIETLEEVGKQIAGHEDEYDQRDPNDLDEDGNYMEPDGLLDNLFIVHSGIGEEAGGGDLGENAIWSHRSTIGDEPIEIPGTSLKAYDYIIQPEDGAIGVFAHEYGHNLGLPDEYDTGYSGSGSPVEVWSLMSGGSWAGKIPGTEPTGISPWGKLFFSETLGGNWPTAKTIDVKNIKSTRKLTLNEAVADSKTGKILKIDLPDRDWVPPTQPKGELSYSSTKGNSLDTKMVSPEIDLTKASEATLTFDSWRDIEIDYDFLYVNVYTGDSDEPELVKTISDNTKGKWESTDIDLSEFKGNKIRIEFEYKTDVGLALEGFYVDNIVVKADDETVFEDDAETDPKFELDGFKIFDGKPVPSDNFYLVEWRTHNGVDEGLAHYRRSNSLMSFDEGMLVWYYDGRYGEDNMTGKHPGEGFLGVVDAHQREHKWSDGKTASTRYQVVDAAFGLKETSPINVEFPTFSMEYEGLRGVSTFDDSEDYSSPFNPAGGKLLPKHGLKIKVKKVNKYGNQVDIEISRKK